MGQVEGEFASHISARQLAEDAVRTKKDKRPQCECALQAVVALGRHDHLAGAQEGDFVVGQRDEILLRGEGEKLAECLAVDQFNGGHRHFQRVARKVTGTWVADSATFPKRSANFGNEERKSGGEGS